MRVLLVEVSEAPNPTSANAPGLVSMYRRGVVQLDATAVLLGSAIKEELAWVTVHSMSFDQM